MTHIEAHIKIFIPTQYEIFDNPCSEIKVKAGEKLVLKEEIKTENILN